MKIKHTLALVVSSLAIGLAPGLAHAQNTAYGTNALVNLTTGDQNAAFGDSALFLNNVGVGNSAFGISALRGNKSGYSNTGIGNAALYSNTLGSYNTGIGAAALYSNTTGAYNVAVGYGALAAGGVSSVAIGVSALQGGGGSCIAIGANAALLGAGPRVIAIGEETVSMASPGVGGDNIAIGYRSLLYASGTGNVSLGNFSGYGTGNYNITIGMYVGGVNSGNNDILIGSLSFAGESNTIRIGRTDTHTAAYVAGIEGAAVTSGSLVFSDSSGKLGTLSAGLPITGDIGIAGGLFTVPGPVGSQPQYPSGPHSFTAVLQGRTTTTTPTVDLTVDGNAPAVSGTGMNVLIPPNNTTWYYRIAIVARSDSGATNPGSSHGWSRWGMIKNTGGTISAAGAEGTDAAVYDGPSLNWTITRNATLSGYFRYTVSQATTTFPSVEWTARLDITSVAN